VSRVLLDTTAVLAHYLDELGAEEVSLRLGQGDAWVASPTGVEFSARLRALGATSGEAAATWATYRAALAGVVPIDEATETIAVDLRLEASARIPTVDLLIAAAAVAIDAELVHRDEHFDALSPERPKRRGLGRPPPSSVE
jgi:predicted nucleic acid-binding protein